MDYKKRFFLKDKYLHIFNFFKDNSLIVFLSSLVIVSFVSIVISSPSNNRETIITKNSVSNPTHPVKWTLSIPVNQIKKDQHIVEIPTYASNVNITLASSTKELGNNDYSNVDRIKLSELAKENSKSLASQELSKSLQKKSFIQKIFSVISKASSYMFATVEDALAEGTETTTIDIAPVVNLETEDTIIEEEVVEEQQTTTTEEVIEETSTTTEQTETIATTTEEQTSTTTATTTEEQIQETSTTTSTTTESLATTSSTSTEKETISTSTASTTEEISTTTSSTTEQTGSTKVTEEQLASSTDVVLVEYETPAPVFAEAETETGKIVTVSAKDTEEEPIVDVLAFTNIPEIYKVGQENKIKIKWTNNDNQNVTFRAYDLNNNGKLDYIEWIVPHLSTQTFEIIFISKAFQLDQDKNIIADIYEEVSAQDNVWTTIENSQYMRVTFEQLLDDSKDITIYARPSTYLPTENSSIDVYPVYTDGEGNTTVGDKLDLVNDKTNPDFSNITNEGKYRVLLSNLKKPTKVFDLKFNGNIDVDYVVDPDTNTWIGGTDNNYSTDSNWSLGHKPVAGENVAVANSVNLVINEATAALNSFDMTGYTGTLSGSGNITVTVTSGTSNVLFAGTSPTWSGILYLNPETGTVINFTGNNNIFDHLIINNNESGFIIFEDSSTFNQLTINAPKTILFNKGTTQNIGKMVVNSSSTAIVTLGATTTSFSTSTSTPILNLTGTPIVDANLDYLNIQGINVTPVNAWNTGLHSIIANSGLYFSGNGYISIPNSPTANQLYPAYPNGYSAEIWVKTKNYTNGGSFFDKSNYSIYPLNNKSGYKIFLNDETGKLQFYTISNGWEISISNENIIFDQLSHIVITVSYEGYYYPAQRQKIYINGNEVTYSNYAGSMYALGDDSIINLYIGKLLDGEIYSVRIYKNVILNSSEISTLYNAGLDAINPLNKATSEYLFNEGTGNITTDRISGVTGAITGATWLNSGWVAGVVPDAPLITSTESQNGQVKIDFTPPEYNGGLEIDYYIAESNPEGIIATTTNTSTITVTGLTNYTPYTFTMYAHNLIGISNTSSVSEEVIPKNIPNIPVLVSPVNEFNTMDTTPTLSVLYSDSDQEHPTGVTHYRIATSSENCLSEIVVNSGTSTETSSNYATTTYTPSSSLTDGTYYWCAQNYNGLNSSEWASMGSFTVDTIAPTGSISINNGAEYSISKSITVTNNSSGDAYEFNTYCYYGCIWGTLSTNPHIYTSTETFDGVITKNVRFRDKAGNESPWYSDNIIIDTAAATATLEYATSTETNELIVTFVCNDNIKSDFNGIVEGSGCDRVYYELDGSDPNTSSPYVNASSSWQLVLSLSESYDINFFTKDLAGNLGPHSEEGHHIVDRSTPATSDNFTSNNTWTNSYPTITLDPYDPYPSFGMYWTRYCLDTDNSCEPVDGHDYTTPITIETEGTSYFRYASEDNAGNRQSTVSRTVKIDTVDPTTTASSSNNYTFGTWSNSNITVTLTADDATSGTASTKYCIDTDDSCTPSSTYSDPVTISAEGTNYFRYSSEDNAGNTETVQSKTIKIDKQAPVISNISPVDGSTVKGGDKVTFTLSKVGECRLALSAKSYDDMSGDVNCSVTNGIQMSCTLPSLTSGTKSVYLACKDYLGNKDTALTATHLTYIVTTSQNNDNEDTDGSRKAINELTKNEASTTDAFDATVTYKYFVSINGNSWTTNNRIVDLQLSTDPKGGANAVMLADNPNFTNAITIPFTEEVVKYDLCRERKECSDKSYSVYAKFIDKDGKASKVISESITLNAVPLITEISSSTKELADTIASTTKDIFTVILPTKKVAELDLPDINTSVPEVAPFAMLNSWKITIPSTVSDFVFTDLPSDFKNIISKFPSVSTNIKSLDITSMNKALTLNAKPIILPGISSIASSTSKLPTNIVFARTTDEKIDINTKLSIDTNGLAIQTLNTVQGQSLNLTVKPDAPAKSIEGYIIFKSSKVSQTNSLLQTASVLNAVDEVTENTDLVLTKFYYKEAKNGVWTADVDAPLATGQYELKTVVNYKEKKNQEKISMVMIVDPEGYVYKMQNGEEVRVNNAVVSIYKENPETKQYELWNAEDYKQTNPQITDVTGRYSFLVPIGNYYITATAKGYYDYRSEVIEVEEGKAVIMNIKLTDIIGWISNIKLLNILLIGIFILLVYLSIIFTIRHGKKELN